MSDRGRGNSRGRGARGGGSGGGRGGHGGGGGPQKKENILDLGKYMDKKIHVKYTGGREVIGTLKGYDPLLNLVLDDTEELVRDPEDNYRVTDQKRSLGLVVCRGTAIIVISPEDGTEEIANPFAQPE
ncbi:U6 snRNA-associated Sm-like protein LSm7-like protein [Fimicolochytrium jonesii]|uniref:U6 snRNA-associated Sm-like protein LSm7-like protein n=1 Tax=Fimicolochytrium jonesii TaxID=1396493 RepID=UPI0022FF3815|nr:U6 snRNA-associated Sm-like protein LSm7-like protein [Fimicolochytrium jonesii]KAI8819240.1 U6 snRNA-associated Sm-like protein LSm7-like protein [Fimicolochytrium jonesii]